MGSAAGAVIASPALFAPEMVILASARTRPRVKVGEGRSRSPPTLCCSAGGHGVNRGGDQEDGPVEDLPHLVRDAHSLGCTAEDSQEDGSQRGPRETSPAAAERGAGQETSREGWQREAKPHVITTDPYLTCQQDTTERRSEGSDD